MCGAALARPADGTGRATAQTSLEVGRYEVGAACTARAKLLQCNRNYYMWYAANRNPSRCDTPKQTERFTRPAPPYPPAPSGVSHQPFFCQSTS